MQQGIGLWLERWAAHSPDKPAIIGMDTTLTYAELNAAANRFAAVLDAEGFGPGDIHALMMGNEPDFLVVFWGVVKSGGVFMPLSPSLTGNEVTRMVATAQPRSVWYGDEFATRMDEYVGDAGLRHGRVSDLGLHQDTPAPAPTSEIALESPVAVLFTSGTTGDPKGALLSHQSIMFNTLNYIVNLRLSSDDRHLVTLPLAYTGGLITSCMTVFHTGATMVLERKFEAGRTLRLIEEHRATVFMGVPTMYRMMRADPGFGAADLSSLRLASAGGAPTPPELAQVYFDKGVDIVHPYGITEAAGFNLYLLPEDSAQHKGSVGRPTLYTDAKIVDDAGNDAADGEIGELALSGPMVMLGYLNNPEASAQALRDGWLYTGDLGHRDPDGYFYLAGRKKEMIISGGLNVFPNEIEHVIAELPWIRECAVVGLPDEHWGELVVAVVVVDEPGHTAEEIQTFCGTQIAAYKVPKQVAFVDELPKGSSGKVLKTRIKAGLG